MDEAGAGFGGLCCICCDSCLQPYCNTKAYGGGVCCGGRGCCPNCGGFNDEDKWDADDRKRKAGEAKTTTQPEASPGMTTANRVASGTASNPAIS
ncbi:hypothetical protein FRB94_008719 [Tulasnella sp. JGI-2019a]|nr:hypothetical protein FRB94_008719 [Tulasnella sp. JGI-2019a]KAG8997465.1 hypothetical protein FRB93_014076 [Tulasnella sp. JGI-2019a]KAG9028268.1 hypothetical protein FRB95_006634 [Tulasnella sp. JGI-2019a]